MHPTTVYSRLITVALAVAILPPAARAQEVKSASWFSIQSTFGRYLQAHTDGETHASNDHRGNEETWIILKTDTPDTYAIKNARTGKYLSFQEGGCFRANRDGVNAWEKFYFKDAGNNWLRIQSARTDFPGFLGTQQGGTNTSCGGEVKSDQGSLEWTIRTHDTVEDSGGVDVGKVVTTAADLAKIVTTLVK